MLNYLLRFLLASIIVHLTMTQLEATAAPKQPSVGEFNSMLRKLDLNADTQNGYSITRSEYAQLSTAWYNLSMPDRQYLVHGRDGWKDFVQMLLTDLIFGTSWEDHVKKAVRYQAKELALTASRYKSVISLKRARKTLVDFLYDGPSMFTAGRLTLDEQIKIKAKERAGRKALSRLEKWQTLINAHQEQSDWKKLVLVNDFFNRQIDETLDRGAVKGYDYWQSPVETLVRGKGDCDDFAVAKYVSLRLLGIPAEQLRVGVVEHTSRGGHGVLLFYPLNENDPWVLDNLISWRLGPDIGNIRRLSAMVNFNEIKPLWGLNENVLTEFSENLSETITQKDPRDVYPAFATALVNSRRLLTPRRQS